MKSWSDCPFSLFVLTGQEYDLLGRYPMLYYSAWAYLKLWTKLKDEAGWNLSSLAVPRCKSDKLMSWLHTKPSEIYRALCNTIIYHMLLLYGYYFFYID